MNSSGWSLHHWKLWLYRKRESGQYTHDIRDPFLLSYDALCWDSASILHIYNLSSLWHSIVNNRKWSKIVGKCGRKEKEINKRNVIKLSTTANTWKFIMPALSREQHREILLSYCASEDSTLWVHWPKAAPIGLPKEWSPEGPSCGTCVLAVVPWFPLPRSSSPPANPTHFNTTSFNSSSPYFWKLPLRDLTFWAPQLTPWLESQTLFCNPFSECSLEKEVGGLAINLHNNL
jgi:hypothetical protein